MAFKVSTGIVRVPIERDDQPVGEIKFNPADTAFREKVVELYHDADKQKDRWSIKAAEIDAMTDGESGSAESFDKFTAISALEKEAFEYFKALMDQLFGVGSGAIVFGDSPLDVDTTGTLFIQFMQEAVTPHLKEHVEKRKAKYVK